MPLLLSELFKTKYFPKVEGYALSVGMQWDLSIISRDRTEELFISVKTFLQV
jgi:hypothetical protein